MEILQLLQMKEAFEETSIDYCVTFEVSPPAYEAPANKITTSSRGSYHLIPKCARKDI